MVRAIELSWGAALCCSAIESKGGCSARGGLVYLQGGLVYLYRCASLTFLDDP